MLIRPVLLSACALTLAGCQMFGGTTRPTPAPGEEPGAPASAISAPAPPSPWAAARARGVVFRAVGTTSDWTLEVSKSRTVTVAMAASKRHLEVPGAAIASDATHGMITFSGNATDGTPVQIVVHRGQCKADMHEKKSAAAVELDVGPTQYEGCGRFLIQ